VPRRSIDLSADVGEIEGSAGRAIDAAVIMQASTVHVACGGHAGDQSTMRRAVADCVEQGTVLGAHPSYPDREGFGRQKSSMGPGELLDSVAEQLAALDQVAAELGTVVRSVKPHGRLYHDAENDLDLAAGLIELLAARPEPTALVLQAVTQHRVAASAAGLLLLAEGFCDRRYTSTGRLVDRAEASAMLDDPGEAAAQALTLAMRGLEVADRVVQVDTLCLHSDAPGVLARIDAVRRALSRQGIVIAAVAQ